MKSTLMKDLLWGNSVALAWTWGYGTYLSIQIALAFGLYGLLIFCIPNAIGLALFGVLNHHLSQKLARKNIDIETYFFEKTQKYTAVFIVFQLLALSINAFCFIRYVAIPLGYSPLLFVFLLLVIPLFLIGYGRTSNIRWIHLFLGVFIFSAMIYLVAQWHMSAIKLPIDNATVGLMNAPSIYFIGWSALTIFSLIFAPWLDIQHWQRAVQIQKDHGNLRRSYIWGAILFFMIIFFHGCAALYLKLQGIHFISELFIGDQVSYRYSMVTNWANYTVIAGTVYVSFLFFIAIGGIASSLAGFRWYLLEKTKQDHSLKLYLLYLIGFLLAYGCALAGLQEEAYVVTFSFFILYAYSLFWMLFDAKHDLSATVDAKNLLITSVAFFVIMLSTASYINVFSGMVLLLLPFLMFVSVVLIICHKGKLYTS